MAAIKAAPIKAVGLRENNLPPLFRGNARFAQLACKRLSGQRPLWEGSGLARLRGRHMKTCPDCNGDGVVDRDTDDERQCPTCGGLGFVPDDDDDHDDVINTSCDLPHSVGGKP